MTSADLSNLDAELGADEQRTETYQVYDEGAAQAATTLSAKSTSSVASSASKQAGAFQRFCIGVFDSGVGGLSVVHAIEKALPQHTIIYRDDKKNIPYGSKTPDQLLELTIPIFTNMVQEGCDVIVVACNTVTTTIIKELREVIPVPLVGIEPMVKPAAALTKSGVIAVCATPTTLASGRYHELKETYAKGVTVLEPDCSEWSRMIQDDQIDRQKIELCIKEALGKDADVIVLGCTHYHWIEQMIKEIAETKAQVLQPEPAIIEQLKRVLVQLP
jgi:glutamate racemase